MTFRQMEIFLAVCDYRSISKAAAAQFITQQSASRAIQEIESEMNCTLLKRTSSGVMATRYGAYVLEECRMILKKRDEMMDRVHVMQENERDPLVVGMAFGAISSLPMDFLSQFARMYPSIDCRYTDDDDMRVEERLDAGELDAAITTGIVDGEKMDSELIKSESIFLCIPRKHPLSLKHSVYMNDLVDEPFVMFSDRFHIHHGFMESCRHVGIEPKVTMLSSDFNSLKELALQMGQLFVVPEHTVRYTDPEIEYVPFPDPYYKWNLYFVVRKNKLMTDSMLTFLTYTRQRIAQGAQSAPML